MNHPDLYDTAVVHLKSEDFVSELNKRIYVMVLAQLENSQSFSISMLGDAFSPREIGYISKLLNSGFEGNSPKDVLLDCISVLKTEKNMSAKTETVDDWVSQMRKIAEDKKGN